MTTHVAWENDAITQYIPSEDWRLTNAYRFDVLITKDEEGCYSAVVLNLPGIGSCGSSEEEAMANVREAIRGALDEYQASGEEIPWKDVSALSIPSFAELRRIIVDA